METENKLHPLEERLARFKERVALLDPKTVSVVITDSPMHMKYHIALYGATDKVVIELPYDFFVNQAEHPLHGMLISGFDQTEAFVRKYYGLPDNADEPTITVKELADYFREKLDPLSITTEHDLRGFIFPDGIHISAFTPKGDKPIAQSAYIPGNMICKLLGNKASERSGNLRKILFAYKMTKENQNAKNS